MAKPFDFRLRAQTWNQSYNDNYDYNGSIITNNLLNIIFITINFMSKINSEFLKKSINEMIAERKKRKFV